MLEILMKKMLFGHNKSKYEESKVFFTQNDALPTILNFTNIFPAVTKSLISNNSSFYAAYEL